MYEPRNTTDAGIFSHLSPVDNPFELHDEDEEEDVMATAGVCSILFVPTYICSTYICYLYVQCIYYAFATCMVVYMYVIQCSDHDLLRDIVLIINHVQEQLFLS